MDITSEINKRVTVLEKGSGIYCEGDTMASIKQEHQIKIHGEDKMVEFSVDSVGLN